MATVPGIATPDEYVGATLVREQTSLWADAWRRLKRNRLALVSTIFLGLLLLVALVAIFWTPYPIWRQGVAPTYQTPNSQFLLGADQAGRDILSRLMVGAQVSLEVGVGTQIVVAVIG
ncbi:MAG: ABC transporter permease, partial [Chloroflexi bacterium]